MNITNIIQSVPPEVVLILLAPLASAFQQKIKHYLELENPKLLVLLAVVFSAAASVIPALLGWMSANSAALVGHGAEFFTAMTLAYRYVIQPGGNTLNGFVSDIKTAKALRSQTLAAADGVVIAPTVTSSGSEFQG